MRSFPFILLFCIAPVASEAQESPPPLTVEAAVRMAIQNNPRLSAAVREWSAAESGLRSARALTNPEIVFTPGLDVGGSDEELIIRQPLELNGTRVARRGIASARLRAARAEAIIEMRSLVAETKAAYYELARARELLSLATDLLQTAEEFDRLTRRQVELEVRPGIDLAQTGIEVSRAKQQVALAESQVTAAQAALNTLLGRPAPAPIGSLAPLTFTSQSIEEEVLLRQALSARAEITVEEAGAEAFRQEARLARAEGLPDLAPQLRAGQVTRRLDDYGVGIAITLPLFDYGQRRHRIRQAEEAARARADRVAAARNQVRQEVHQTIAQLRAAETVLKEYQQGILERARRLLDASRIGFQEGHYSLTQILEAQRTFRAVQTEYIHALVNHAQALAELERVTGAVPASLLPTPREAAR